MTTLKRPPRDNDQGSLPLAMVVTVFCLVLSALALTGLSLQVTRSAAEQADDYSAASLDSGIAFAAQQLSSETQRLCSVPYSQPENYQPAPDGKSGFRWWADKTDIASGKMKLVVESHSGNPGFEADRIMSADYQWDSAKSKWQITNRHGNEVFPYPETPNAVIPSTPARFTSTPVDRGIGTNFNYAALAGVNYMPSINDAIASDGRYVWVGGDFTEVTGANGTFPRVGIAKFDTQTGNVEPWTITLSAGTQVRAMVLKDDTIYMGGSFTSVNGTPISRLAKVDKTSGTLDTNFNVGTTGGNRYGPESGVNTIAYDSSRDVLLVGGTFSLWVGDAKPFNPVKFAAVSPTTGLLAPSATQGNTNFTESIRQLVVTGDGVVLAAGKMYTPDAESIRKIAGNGTVTASGMNVSRGGFSGRPQAMAVNPDNPNQVAIGFLLADALGDTPEMVRMYQVSNGATLWTTPTGHDVHTVAWFDGIVYASFHSGMRFDGTNPTTRLIALRGTDGVRDTSFDLTFPTSNVPAGPERDRNFWGPTKMVATDKGLAVWGGFTEVNGQPADHFAWFPNEGGCSPAESGSGEAGPIFAGIGNNYDGQLGTGNTDAAVLPVSVDTDGALSGRTVTKVSTSGSHSCAIADGAAYCWGMNNRGQLGDGTTITRLSPVPVTGLPGTVTDISVGMITTCAVSNSTTYCWGSYNYWAGGSDSHIPVAINTGTLAGKIVTKVSVGSSRCVIADGALYCWDHNGYGTIGNGTTQWSSSANPAAVATDTGMTGVVTDVSARDGNTCAVAGGQAFCWGLNSVGQLGIGSADATTHTKPRLISGSLTGATVTSIDASAGGGGACAVADGQAYCWGVNDSGQLGDGTTVAKLSPTLVSGVLIGKTVSNVEIAHPGTGYGHSCAIADAALYCWGNNDFGQLATGTTTSSLVPVAGNGGVLSGATSSAVALSSAASTLVIAQR